MNESFLNGQEIVEQITSAFYEHLNAVNANVSALNKLGSSYGKLPSDYLKTIKDITDAQLKQAKSERELANASAASYRAKVAEAALRIKESQEIREQIRLQNTQEKQVRATGGAYKSLRDEYNAVSLAAKNLGADMYMLEAAGEQNTETYSRLQAEFAETQAKALSLNGALGNIEQSVGQHQRNVGNYKSGFDSLGNSINQVTRELPAFAVSMNTGFLAISNNLPMLFDELRRIRLETEQLRSQGEKVPSVLSQVARSFFSWQTALSAGVTLLTLYGGKLIEMVTNTRAAAKETDLLTEAQDRYNNTIVETTTNSEAQLTGLRRLLAVAKDVSKSDEERRFNAKQLIEQYPGYLKGLSEEAIMLEEGKQNTQEYNKAMRQLTSDIQDRIKAEAQQRGSRETLKIAAELEQEAKIREDINAKAREYYNKYGENSGTAKAEVNALRERVKARQELLKEDQEFISKFGQLGVATTGSVNMLGLYEPSQIVQLQLRAQRLRAEIEKQNESINETYLNTSLLDFKPDEQQQELQYQDSVDFQASLYELTKTRLENEAAVQEQIFNDEEQNYDKRQQAAANFHRIQRELANNELQEQLRIITLESNTDIAEYKRRVKENEITQQNANQASEARQKQAEYDSLLAYENYRKRMGDISNELHESLKGVWEGISDQQRNNTIDSEELDAIRQLNLELNNLTTDSDYKKFKELEDRKVEIFRASAEERIQIELQRVAADIDLLQKEAQLTTDTEKKAALNEALEKLYSRQISLQGDLASAEQERLNKTAGLTRELKAVTEDYLRSFTDGALADAGFEAIGDFFQKGEDGLTDFERRFKGAGDNIGKQFAVAFTTITEIAQQAFAFMDQASQRNFDLERERLEARYAIAKKFAGDNQAAQEELQREYEQKQAEIERRQLQKQKEQAIFNAVINTAQGVTAALAEANIPLSIIIAALGAAQIGFIASQQIPAFATGGVTEQDGNILVNDAPGSRYEEVVVTPEGKTIKPKGRNRVINVPKGTKIYPSLKAHEESLNKMLSGTGIAPNSDALNRVSGSFVMQGGNGMTKEDMRAVMKETLGAMKQTVQRTELNASGFNHYVENGHSRMQLRNGYLNLEGRTIGR